MAKCPTCDAEIVWDAAECRNCLTVFRDDLQLRPIGQSREEKQKLRERYGGVHPQSAGNPYAPPDAPVDDNDAQAPQGRPGWVWAITIFFGLGAVWGLIWWLMALANVAPADEATRAYLQTLTVFDYVLPIANTTISLCGLILLFLMRARAPVFLLASLALNVFGVLYSFAVKNIFATFGILGAINMVVGPVIWVLVVWYAYRLRKTGRLR